MIAALGQVFHITFQNIRRKLVFALPAVVVEEGVVHDDGQPDLFLRGYGPGGVARLIDPLPLAALLVFIDRAAVFLQKLHQGVHIHPDLVDALLLAFVENQLKAEMEVGDFDVVDAFPVE